MARNKKKTTLSTEEKLYKAMRGLFVIQARQLDMGNEGIREILGIDKAEINAIAKLVNQAIRKHGKGTKRGNS